jgi:hypothetical protein
MELIGRKNLTFSIAKISFLASIFGADGIIHIITRRTGSAKMPNRDFRHFNH